MRILALALIASLGLAAWLYKAYQARGREIAALRGHLNQVIIQSKPLQEQIEAYSQALERMRLDAGRQAERLNSAQAEASRARAQSESRVQEILTRPGTDDTRELIDWAAAESKKLGNGLKEPSAANNTAARSAASGAK